jgi:WD40 repeat protein
VLSDPAHPSQFTVGPPKRLPFHAGDRGFSVSRDGRVLAQAMYAGYGMQDYAGGWIIHPEQAQPRRVEDGASMNWASVSPDGRWVAFGQHNNRVNVNEAKIGRRVWQSPSDKNYYCRFSPDNQWLVSGGEGGRAYAVGTWQPGPALGPGTPWDVSRDGLVVIGLADGVYRLIELVSGREIARLEDPDLTFGGAVFTPDGTRLVVVAKDGLRVWDLRRMRVKLEELGLDWDQSPYPTEPDAHTKEIFEARFSEGNPAP